MSKLELTEQQIQEARRIFDKHDADKSGTIEFHELKGLLEETTKTTISPKLYERYVKTQFAGADKNEDGVIQWEEFLTFYKKIYASGELPINVNMQAAPRKPASSSSQLTSASSFRSIKEIIPEAKALSEQEVAAARAAFDKYDADKSNSIDKSELSKLLEEQQQNKKMSKLLFDRLVNMHMNSVDKEGTGQISFEQFLKLYAKIFGTEGQKLV